MENNGISLNGYLWKQFFLIFIFLMNFIIFYQIGNNYLTKSVPFHKTCMSPKLPLKEKFYTFHNLHKS